MQNIYWKELGLLVAMWATVLALQIAKVLVCFVFIFPSCDATHEIPVCFGHRITKPPVQWYTGY